MSSKIHFILILAFVLGGGMTFAKPDSVLAKTEIRALWVECEGSNDTLSSKKKITQMLDIASQNRINLIYVQLFRGQRAWYKSELVPTTPYQQFLRKEKTDMLSFLLREAHRRNIEVHGWINQLRVVRNAQNKYPVLERLGKDVVTRNGQGISLWDFPKEKLPDGGYWLDPGDDKVQQFLAKVAAELLRNYPQLDGIHLDFIRIPFDVPYPGSRWDGGKGFGYGKRSVERFRQRTGLNPLKMEKTRENTQRWDDWRRDQVTQVVRGVRKAVKAINPKVTFSIAAMCWTDRAYLSSYQDWGGWLKKGIVDAAVVMNYSIDSKFVNRLARQAIALRYNGEVHIGLGAYLLSQDLRGFQRQIKETLALSPDGIVYFSYDSMLKKPEMFDLLSSRQPWRIKKVVQTTK